jgi:hypothetical protein
MGKRSKESENTTQGVEKKSKKQKKDEAPATDGLFSLFGGAKDSELDDIFSKSVSFYLTVGYCADVFRLRLP